VHILFHRLLSNGQRISVKISDGLWIIFVRLQAKRHLSLYATSNQVLVCMIHIHSVIETRHEESYTNVNVPFE
jgi:hypothetical protein